MALNPPPTDLDHWIDQFRDKLKPPIGKKLLYEEEGMIAQIIGGRIRGSIFATIRSRSSSYRRKGDMILKVFDAGEIRDVRINQGEVFILPPHTRHSPQCPIPGSIGLVAGSPRIAGMLYSFE